MDLRARGEFWWSCNQHSFSYYYYCPSDLHSHNSSLTMMLMLMLMLIIPVPPITHLTKLDQSMTNRDHHDHRDLNQTDTKPEEEQSSSKSRT